MNTQILSGASTRFSTVEVAAKALLYAAVLFASICVVPNADAAASYLLPYPKAPYDGATGTYTLKADGTPVDVTAYYGGRYSFAHVAFEGTTTFAVSTRNGAAITSFNISPHSTGLNAVATKSGSTLTFNVTQANSTYLIISVSTSAGALEKLVIAGDPKETGAPSIGGSVKDITAAPYNADSTGNTLLNSTIQNAIDTVSSGGGGTLYFPAGVYEISNNISIKSNVTLYLAPGAFLRGSSNRNDYTWKSTLQNGQPEFGYTNFVISGGASNVAINGRGVIDANSTILVAPATTGGTIDGNGNYRKGIISSALNGGDQPNGITLEGITVKDSTTWTFDIEDALNVSIRNVKMVNDYNWLHSDGYDICSTSNAVVDNCLGVTGDDVFCAKGTSSNPLNNVTYSNGVTYGGNGDGTKMGVGAICNSNNVVFSNIDVILGQRAVSVSHDENSGNWTNIHFNDIRMENSEGSLTSGEYLDAPIVIWTLNKGGSGPVSNVALCRVSVENSGGRVSVIQGNDSVNNVSNVTLQDVTIDGIAITSSNYSSKIKVGANVSGLHFGIVPGGVYTLVNAKSGLALDNDNTTTNGGIVVQWTPNGGATQQWIVTAIGSNYTLVSRRSGLALDNSSSSVQGFGMTQWGPNKGTQQQWALSSAGGGFYKLISAQSGMALDDDNSTANGTQVVQWSDNGSSPQRWTLTKD